MKYLIFIPSFLLSYQLIGQDLATQLQKQLWYVRGNIYKGDTCSIYLNKPETCSGYLIFTEGLLEMNLEADETKFVCSYETLNNKMKLTYIFKYKKNKETAELKRYYKLNEQENGHDFELIPIASGDYK